MTDLDCVLFDLDNTLLPFMQPLQAWARTWARTAAPGREDEVARELVQATLEHKEDPVNGIEEVTVRNDLPGDLQEADEKAHEAYDDALAPYPGVCELLATLQREGYTLGVVTDAPRDRAMHRLESTELCPVFRVIVTRDDTPRGKQGPEPFQQALSVLGARPEKAAMVGDWPAYDVRWPRRLGMRAILAAWDQDPEDPRSQEHAPPCPVASAPSEVPDLLDDGPVKGPTVRGSRQAALTAF